MLNSTGTTQLYRRGAIYYIRVIVPSALRAQMKRREITLSLHEADRQKARQKLKMLSLFLNEVFERALKMPELSIEVVDEVVRRFFKQELNKARLNGSDPTWDAFKASGQFDDRILELRTLQYPGPELDEEGNVVTPVPKPLSEPVTTILKELDVPVPATDHPLFQFLIGEVYKARQEAARIEEAIMLGREHAQQLPQGKYAIQGVPQVAFPVAPAFLPPPTAPKNLDSWITEFAAENVRANKWRAGKVEVGNTRKLQDFAAVVGGHKQLHEITDADIKHYRDLVFDIPTNFRKGASRSKETIEQSVLRVRVDGAPKLNPKSVETHFLQVKALFKRARVLRYIPHDPTEGLLAFTVSKDVQRKRPAFKPEHFKMLFESEAFANLERDYQLVTLLCVYLGTRESEIVNLWLNEIHEKDGHYYVLLKREKDGKIATKTTQSSRIIPIHNDLIKYGLIEHIQWLKDINQKYLFPQVVYEPDKRTLRKNPADAFGKKFAYHLKKTGLRDQKLIDELGGNLTFHGIRHSFKDYMTESEINETYSKALMGHSSGKDVHSSYGSGLPIKKMAEKMNAITFNLPIEKVMRQIGIYPPKYGLTKKPKQPDENQRSEESPENQEPSLS